MAKPRSIHSLFFSLLLTLLTVNPASAQCYKRRSGAIITVGTEEMNPCNNTEIIPGGAQQCCNGDDDQICGTDRLCRNKKGLFYVGGCTDSTYRDPVCRSECTWYRTTWVGWVTEEAQWHCCTDSMTNGCGAGLQNETFNAVAPSQWVSVIAANVSSAANETSPEDGESEEVIQESDTLSQGAAIGIGFAAAVGGMAVILACVWFSRLYRRKNSHRNAESEGLMPKNSKAEVRGVIPVGTYRSEMRAVEDPKELHARQTVRELPA